MTDTQPTPTRVFLVTVDDTPEMSVALSYACRRALHTDGRVALLHVVAPADFQHWMAVEDLIREEARSEAERLLQRHARTVMKLMDKPPIIHLREGDPRDELLALIEEDPSISILVLGAGTGKDGPGPLVTYLTGKGVGRLRVPLTIVPDTLTEADLDDMA